jgi:hypothetical protein
VRHREGSSWQERIGPRVRVRNRALWPPSLAGRVAANSPDRRGGLRGVVSLGVDPRRGQAHLCPHSGRDLPGPRGGRARPAGDRADVRGGVRGRHRRLPRLGRRGRGPAGRPRRCPGHGRGRVSRARGDRRQGGRYLGDDHPHNLPCAGHWPSAGALSGGPDRGCDRPPDKRRVARQPRTHGGGGRPPALRRFGGRAGGGGGRPG